MKKITQYYVGVILILMILSSCSSNNNSDQGVFKYKGSYIGDNSAVGNIINRLPYSKEFREVSLQTQKKPYGMIIQYGDVAGNIKNNVVNNSTYIFVLIKNADWITFNFPNKKYTLTRQQLQKWYGEDLNKINDEKEIKKLIQTNLNDANKVSKLLKK